MNSQQFITLYHDYRVAVLCVVVCLIILAIGGLSVLRKRLKDTEKPFWIMLAISSLIVIAIMLLNIDKVSGYWAPHEQNWKYEYNATNIVDGETIYYGHSNPHGSSVLIAASMLIFGKSHTAAVILNALAFFLTALFISLCSARVFKSNLALLLSGPLLATYPPMTALWAYGGDYLPMLAAFSFSLWLILRTVEDDSLLSFILTATAILLAVQIRIEGMLLWILWPVVLVLHGKYKRNFVAIAAPWLMFSITLVFYAIWPLSEQFATPVFPTNIALINSSGIAMYMTTAIPALILALWGTVVLFKKSIPATLSLWALSGEFFCLWIPGPSMDHFQVSVYFMLPLTILAGGSVASLKIKPLYTYILTATAIIASLLPISPAEAYLNSQMNLWQSQDKEVRTLAQNLPDDTSIMGNPPHILMAMPEHQPVRKFLPKLENGMDRLLETLDGFACFEPSDSPGSCAFTEELFPSKAGAFLLEPVKFGFVQKSKIEGKLFNLVIYENSRNLPANPGDKL